MLQIFDLYSDWLFSIVLEVLGIWTLSDHDSTINAKRNIGHCDLYSCIIEFILFMFTSSVQKGNIC